MREVTLKLLGTPKDIRQCDLILVEHHYLHSARLMGEQLRYAVIWKGQWLAVVARERSALRASGRRFATTPSLDLRRSPGFLALASLRI